MAKSGFFEHIFGMNLMRYIVASLLAVLLTVSQIAFTHAHTAAAMPAEPGQTLVICTPSGLQEIEFPMDQDDPRDTALGSICPHCIVGAALHSTHPTWTATYAGFFNLPCRLSAVSQPVTRAASPYPARGPPS